MKILVAVPSKGRVEILQKKTLSWLSKSLHDWKIFVEPQDYEAYSKVVPLDHLVQITKNDMGLNYALGAVKSFAKTLGYDLVFKVDDDITGWNGTTRRADRENSHIVFDQAILHSIQEFKRRDELGAVGFPYRHQMFELKKWVSVNERLQTAYIIRTDLMYTYKGSGIFEDYAKYIYLRVNNYFTLRYGFAGIDCMDVGENEGGHQSFSRDLERAKEEIDQLRKLYPALKARRVDKRWGIEPDLSGGIFKSTSL